MLPAVKALGDYVCKSEILSIENMLVEASKLDNVQKVLCINFKCEDGKVTYDRIFSENFNQNESAKYLYRVFSHRKFDVTPTSRVTNPEKLKKRFQLWFKQCSDEYLQDPLLSALKNEFLSNLDRIFNDFSERYNLLTKEERGSTIVTITIDPGKHVGDFEIFKKILKNEACSGRRRKFWVLPLLSQFILLIKEDLHQISFRLRHGNGFLFVWIVQLSRPQEKSF